MHMVIRVILYAEDGLSALEKAKDILKKMCGDYRPFDYFVTFDEEGHGMSGKDRWGELPPVARADSYYGKELIAEGWAKQVHWFKMNLKRVRKQIFFPWRWLLKDGMWRYWCNSLYDRPGSNIYLYDNDGGAIGRENHLENALNKWKCLYEDNDMENPYKDLKVFVVPADVHY